MEPIMGRDSDSKNDRSSAESSEGFTFGSVNALRRNLTETFDRQLLQQQHQEPAPSSKPISIADRINQFEQATAHSSKPPMIPSRKQNPNNSVPSDGFAIYLRIRPPAAYDSSTGTNKRNNSKKRKLTSDETNNTIEIVQPENPLSNPTTVRTYPPATSKTSKFNLQRDVHGPKSSAHAIKEFDFHQVLPPETKQQDFYAVVAAPLIESLFDTSIAATSRGATKEKTDPRSALLFSYGITNAGKTHTILGNTTSNQDHTKWGVIPRAISDILDRLTLAHNETGEASDLYVSCFEIYNEQIFDLLPRKTVTARIGPHPMLKLRESRGQILVRGLAKHKISNVGQAVDFTNVANSRRHTSSNNLNAGSSRSHFICQMQIIPSSSQSSDSVASDLSPTKSSGYSTDEEAVRAENSRISTVWIVDLAGSERAKRTGMGSSRQKEASLINKSLLTLMRCLTVMRESGRHNSANVIPFRESKLTHLFMRHLTGSSASRTSMVVNVNPSVADFDETQHVLAYASKAKTIHLKSEELHKKRKQYFADEYDMNGRKKSRTAELGKSFFSKAAESFSPKKVARKLSPKKVFGAKLNDNKDHKAMFGEPKQPPLESMEMKLKADLTSKDEEIRSLRLALSSAEFEIERLNNENESLIDDMHDQERQIRVEVSEEIEERFKATRARNLQELERLKSKLISNPSLCRSTRKVQMDKADKQIQDLLDQVEECEEEMVRLRKEHMSEVETLNARIQELEKRKNVRFDDSSLDQIAQLKKDLTASRKQVECLERSKSELIANYEKLLREEDEEESDDMDDTEDSDTENKSIPRFSAKKKIATTGCPRRPLGMKNTSQMAKKHAVGATGFHYKNILR
eukprot:scaffold1319_cov126-Cylindrotheca_fusiformis.AAC.52